MKLQDRIILVTGAGNGIGRELVLQLLSKRAHVAGVDLSESALSETKRLAGTHQSQFAGHVADITDKPAIQSLPEQVIARFGCVDAIINNAGIVQPFTRVNDLDSAQIERVLNVNLYGTLFVIKAFLPHLLQRPEAHIVNVSSMGGFVPVPGQTIYGAAKAAVKLLSEGLASELASTNVHVTTVFPGAVATNILSNSGVGMRTASAQSRRPSVLQPGKAAQMIVEGIERNSYHVFVGRDAALMDKLYRLNPAFAARAIAKKMGALLK